MFPMILYVSIVISLLYVVLIAYFFYGWHRTGTFVPVSVPEIKVSVVIAMRNEVNTIGNLLEDIRQQSYPVHLFEVVVVDDHSSDGSASRVEHLGVSNVSLLSLGNDFTGKKTALKMGIEASSGALIVFTDADCRVGKRWIECLASYYVQNKPLMMLAPVSGFLGSPFGEMLALEHLSLQGCTAGAATMNNPIMSNGANMAFSRDVYPHICDVYSNPKVSSGDDVFSMLKIKKLCQGGIHFVKSIDAAVFTTFPDTPARFFQQRSRWAGKATLYRDFFIVFTALVVFAANAALLVLLIAATFGLGWMAFLVLILSKSIIDFPFLCSISTFFGQKRVLRWFPVVQTFYFLYVCITVVLAFTFPKNWKNRKITK